MSQNFYLMQKLAETHRHELMREAEQQRLVASLLGRTAMRKPVPTTAPLSLRSPHH